jgi:hypothetical protein
MADNIDNTVLPDWFTNPAGAQQQPAAAPSTAPADNTTLPAWFTTPQTQVQPPAPNSAPNTASNTWTGVARGLGRLMDIAGQGEMATEQTPSSVMPQPGAIADTTTNALLNGAAPYQPTTTGGRIWQNAVANAVTGAPLAAIGPGGVGSFALRQIMNATGALGGETAAEAVPNHPIVAGLIGSLVGGGALPLGVAKIGSNVSNGIGRLAGTQGAIEREALNQFGQQPAMNMPMADIDQTLANSGNPYYHYWTPGRINAASEMNKRQAVNQMINNGTATVTQAPQGLISRILSSDGGPYALGSMIGEPLGNLVGHAVSHVTGLPAELTDLAFGGVGAGAGLLGAYGLKPFMQGRQAVFNQGVEDMLKNQQANLWQQYQQPNPGLFRYATGLAAPAITTTMGQ